MSDRTAAAIALDDELTPEEQALFSGEGDVSAPAETPPAEEIPPAAETPPAAAEEKAQEAPSGEDDEEVEDILEQNGGRFVRHAALHQERMRRKEIQKRLSDIENENRQYRENYSRLDERLRLLNEALAGAPDQQPVAAPGQGQPQQSQVKPPEEDPFAFMRYLADRIDQIGEATQGAHQRFAEQDTYQAVRSAYATDAAAFEKNNPDFRDAYRALLGSRDRELQLIGYADPAQRTQIINNEELMIVQQALQAGKSPAELVYALAQDRGYRKAEQQPAQAAAAPAQASAPAPAPAAPSAVQKVQQVQQATQKNKSLSGTSGGGTAVITPESLANMSEAEFDKLYASLSKADRRALFGG